MKRKYVISLAAAAIGSTALAFTAVHAQGWGHHGGHRHGFGAAGACIVTMTPAQKEGLKEIFTSAKPGLKADFETVKTDRQNVDLAILSGGTNLSDLETTLSKDELTLQQAKDALATAICKNANLSNAKTLYTGLQSQRESNHAAVKELFQAARPPRP
jgi:Spy/CpxP family protein refolding chaperone